MATGACQRALKGRLDGSEGRERRWCVSWPGGVQQFPALPQLREVVQCPPLRCLAPHAPRDWSGVVALSWCGIARDKRALQSCPAPLAFKDSARDRG